jgi:Flp pilus assembly pilin Flp
MLTPISQIADRVAGMRAEDGQGLTEYALILLFIAIVAIAALTFLGSDISSVLSQIANAL